MAFTACDNGSTDEGQTSKTLVSIAITTQPNKTTYKVGESLDTAGMKVTATYSDGSNTAEVTGWTTSGFNSAAPAANQTVTVSYTEGGVTQTATFTVTITASDKPADLPDNASYSDAIAKLDAIIEFCNAHPGNETVKGTAQTRKTELQNIPETSWSGIASSYISQINRLIGQLEDSGDTPGGSFVAVTDITGVPTSATAGTALTLTGTVAPATATNKTIVWSVKDKGTTNATITDGNKLNTTAAGTVKVTATITNGLTESTDYTKDFDITVNPSTGSGNVTITQPGDREADPTLEPSLSEPTGGYTSDFTITASGSGFSSYTWRLDGAVQTGQTAASFTVPVTKLPNGTHSVTLTAVKGGKTYSATQTFKVQR
jgi:hypothetical protein